MVDFARSRKNALIHVNETESAEKLSEKALHRLHSIEKTEPSLSRYVEVWAVSTEVWSVDNLVPITLYVGLPGEFPLKLPKIYLAKADRERLSYLQHVDDDGQVCVFDVDAVHVDWRRPGGIVLECIIKAKRTLEQGLRGENLADFEEEFSAYWAQRYDKQDKVRTELSMLDRNTLPLGPFVKLVSLYPAYEQYRFLLHSDSEEFERVRKYLSGQGCQFKDGTALFLGVCSSSLPFYETNASALEFVKREFPEMMEEFRRYVSKGNNSMIILFARAVQGKYIFYGWQLGPFNLSRQGFRKSELKPWNAFTSSILEARKPVTRISFDTFTNERLTMRTQGTDQPDRPRRIVMIGLGSIGSNLLQYFTATEISRLDLVDPDILAIENIHRHLLGMSYINGYKVKALEAYLKSANPLLDVVPHHISVIPFIKDHGNVLREADMVVVCVGNTNLEEYILSKMGEVGCENPIIVLWVEPFLVGAHCLYMHPGRHYDFGGLFDQGLFRFNVIAASEYRDPQKTLRLKEGGCQSSYVPYGRLSISRFLATLAPHIFDLLENLTDRDCVFSFKGSEAAIRQSNLELSEFGQGIRLNCIQITELNDDPNR
ncbi:E2/UBC family protein [Dyadobacter sp. 32]|uniref:E2/UBC family protein n=1 Tax=Dyadobacter sp. 32 TaxID=538966 RepID=UPI0011EDA7B1